VQIGVTKLTLTAGLSMRANVGGADVLAQNERLWVNGQEVSFSPGTGPIATPAKGDGVETSKRTLTPAQVRVEAAQTSDAQKATAAAQARRAGSLFGVQEPVAQRADVRSLLDGSKVTAQDVEKLFTAGVDAKQLETELIKNGDGPLANLLTGDAMRAVLEKLPAGEHVFLSSGAAALPPGISIKMAEQKLAERGEASADQQIEAMVKQGMTPQEALREVLSHIDPAPVTTNTLVPGSATRPAPPALADPKGENAQLQELLRIPEFQKVYAGTMNRPVTAQDMGAMINAVGPRVSRRSARRWCSARAGPQIA